jgi:hypothetical protein
VNGSMTCILGDKSRFAIEYQLDSPTAGYPGGYICLWAAGSRIGDFDEYVLLGVPEDFFRRCLAHAGQRQAPALNERSKEEILRVVHAALFDEPGATFGQGEEAERRFRKLCMCPGAGKPFDGEFAVLLEELDACRFIWRDKETNIAREVELASGEFEEVVKAFLASLDLPAGH